MPDKNELKNGYVNFMGGMGKIIQEEWLLSKT